jgi:hypothetical protein
MENKSQRVQTPGKPQELKLMVPTYNEKIHPELAMFGGSDTPVIVREMDGLRIVLGTHDFEDYAKPDIHIEHQPNGWVIMMHRDSDAKAYVYLHDDGRIFFQPEYYAHDVEVLKSRQAVPGFDFEEKTDAPSELPATLPGGAGS